MTLRFACIALLAAAGVAVPCKADYLFAYQDSAGNVIGFSEPALQTAGTATNFLFDQNSVTNFAWGGVAPSVCEGVASLSTACTGLASATSLLDAFFPNNSFTAPGLYDGTNGAMVDIVQYTGYLFTYQDSQGKILAFSEPTLQSSGSPTQFLFTTGNVSSFAFAGNTNTCGLIGSLTPFGCTEVNGAFGDNTLFPANSFSSVGTFTSSGTTVNIVQATDTPEPPTALLFPLPFLAGALFLRRRWQRRLSESIVRPSVSTQMRNSVVCV